MSKKNILIVSSQDNYFSVELALRFLRNNENCLYTILNLEDADIKLSTNLSRPLEIIKSNVFSELTEKIFIISKPILKDRMTKKEHLSLFSSSIQNLRSIFVSIEVQGAIINDKDKVILID